MKDMLARLKRYDPATYWNSRKNPNNMEGTASQRVAFDTHYIAARVRLASCVLELGPGVGRTLAAYKPNTVVTTLDLSRSYATELEEKASALDLTLDQHYLGSPGDAFPFADKSFQVGVASQVLLHVPPEFIEHTISELTRTCNELTIITAYRHGEPTVSSRVKHVFNHDYFNLFSALGCEINGLIAHEGRLCFRVVPQRDE